MAPYPFLIALEVILLGGCLFILHRLSTRYGLAPLFFVLATLTTILQLTVQQGVIAWADTAASPLTGTNVLVPVILAGVLLVYLVHGINPARITILGIIVTSLLAQLAVLMLRMHGSLPAVGSLSDLASVIESSRPGLQFLLASVIALAVDFPVMILLYQTMTHRIRRSARWAFPGLTLLVVSWVDGAVLQVLAAFGSEGIGQRIALELQGRTLAALALWPLITYYMARIVPHLPYVPNPDFRPTIDLLTGPYSKLESALTRTQARLRRRQDELVALEATLLEITASQELSTLLHAIVERAVHLLDGTGGGLYICEPERRQVRCVVSHQTPQDYAGTVLPYGEGAAGTIAETGKPLLIGDYRKWTGRADTYEDEQPFRSVLSAPMLWKGDVTGVIHVLHSERTNHFGEPEMKLLQAFANHAAIAVENARLYEREHQRAQELEILHSTLEDLTSELTLSSLLENVVIRAVELLGATGGDLALVDEGRRSLQVVVSHNLGRDYSGTSLSLGEGAMGEAARTGEPLHIENYHTWEGRSVQYQEGPWRGVLAAPLIHNDSLVGAISVVTKDPVRAFTDSDMSLLRLFAKQAAIAIHNASRFSEAQSLAATDSLTGLYNRRAFDQILQRECARAQRESEPLSLVILDIDDFKVYNDTYGHPAGDDQLRMFAALLARNVRGTDSVARYGGEEFAVILPGCTKAAACNLAERIRCAAEATAPDLSIEEGISCPGHTLSLGVATYPDDAETPEELLQAADYAELAAKRAGKNCVKLAEAGHAPGARDAPPAE